VVRSCRRVRCSPVFQDWTARISGTLSTALLSDGGRDKDRRAEDFRVGGRRRRGRWHADVPIEAAGARISACGRTPLPCCSWAPPLGSPALVPRTAYPPGTTRFACTTMAYGTAPAAIRIRRARAAQAKAKDHATTTVARVSRARSRATGAHAARSRMAARAGNAWRRRRGAAGDPDRPGSRLLRWHSHLPVPLMSRIISTAHLPRRLRLGLLTTIQHVAGDTVAHRMRQVTSGPSCTRAPQKRSSMTPSSTTRRSTSRGAPLAAVSISSTGSPGPPL
jgi:hypothetical protein